MFLPKVSIGRQGTQNQRMFFQQRLVYYIVKKAPLIHHPFSTPYKENPGHLMFLLGEESWLKIT